MKAYFKPFLAIVLILLSDQILKFWIKLKYVAGPGIQNSRQLCHDTFYRK